MPNQGNTGDNVGSLQLDQFASHIHTYNQYDTRKGDDSPGSTLPYYMASDQLSNFDDYGGSETRPQNTYVYYLIKFT
jgi:hypothetical protein